MGPLLAGKRILVTREADRSVPMCERIRAYGGEPVVVPVMRIEKHALTAEEGKRWIEEATHADWLVLTSANSLRFFMSELTDPEQISGVRIAVVGKKTGERLADYGLAPDFIPERFTASGLLEAFRSGRIHAKKVAVPLGSLSQTGWLKALEETGVAVSSRVLYDTKPDPSARPRLASILPTLDALTFASPSAVRFFIGMLDERQSRAAFKRCVVAAIGSTTARELERLRHPADVVPKQFTALTMIDALADYYKKRKSYHE
jgi:uroporphyrinogen-III synthase